MTAPINVGSNLILCFSVVDTEDLGRGRYITRQLSGNSTVDVDGGPAARSMVGLTTIAAPAMASVHVAMDSAVVGEAMAANTEQYVASINIASLGTVVRIVVQRRDTVGPQ